MMVLRMFGTTVYASGNLTPNELLHVHRLSEGELALVKSFSLSCEPPRASFSRPATFYSFGKLTGHSKVMLVHTASSPVNIVLISNEINTLSVTVYL